MDRISHAIPYGLSNKTISNKLSGILKAKVSEAHTYDECGCVWLMYVIEGRGTKWSLFRGKSCTKKHRRPRGTR
jgi:hypothetical protein